MKKSSALQQIMDESIPMPGFPQVIVTRGFCYWFLTGLGWDQSERGFGSLDYAVFASHKTDEPVYSAEDRDFWLSKPEIVEMYAR